MSGRQEPKLAIPPSNEEPGWAKSLRESIEGLSQHMAQAVNVMKTPARQVEPPSNFRAPVEEEDNFDPNMLETLTRADFMKLISKTIVKQVNKEIVEPLNGRLTNLQQGLSTTQVEKMIDQAREKYPDLLEYQEEMMELAKVHKTLTPAQLYKLAKDQAPEEKVAKIDAKYRPKDDGKAPLSLTFGGLFPSSGGTTGDENRRMTPRDAADDAWSKVVAELGGEPAFEA